MAIQMVPATVQHHSNGVLRNQKTATRTGQGRSEQNYTATIRETPLPSRSPSNCTKKSPGGLRPAWVTLGPQERIQQHIVEHIVDLSPLVQILDVLVLQMADQMMDVFLYFGTLVPDVAEQVIDVPKIAPQDGNLQRASLRAPQLVEQLMEVPT